jgi:hypothetical protein
MNGRRSLIVGVGCLLAEFLSSSASAAWSWYICTPQEVMAFANRVHVLCTTPTNSIRYFAVATAATDGLGERVLHTATAGMIAGKNLTIGFDSGDKSGTAFGCAEADCRRIQAIGIAR